jgi:metal-responsive CopG/Arc/MetJ family transcriptional regulator
MRTLIDIEKSDLEELDRVAALAKQSRAALVRKAIGEFLQRRRVEEADAFGLWGKGKVDGLAYQHKLRSEW